MHNYCVRNKADKKQEQTLRRLLGISEANLAAEISKVISAADGLLTIAVRKLAGSFVLPTMSAISLKRNRKTPCALKGGMGDFSPPFKVFKQTPRRLLVKFYEQSE